MAFNDYSATPASNTTIGAIGIQGTNLVSNFDNAFRQLMADAKSFTTTAIFGHTAQLAVANTDSVQIIGTTTATFGMSLMAFSATSNALAHIDFYKSANAAIGSATVVASGDALGAINWYAAQQTGTLSNFSRAAQIRAEVDGPVTDGAGADMPGRILFLTSPDASATIAERMRIDSTGAVMIAASGAFVLPQAAAPAPTVEGDMRWDTDDNVLRVGNAATTTQIGIAMAAVQASTSGTAITFGSIPAGTKRITVSLNGVSTNGTNAIILRLGDASSVESAGYVGAATSATSAVTTANYSSAFLLTGTVAAAATHSGLAVLTLLDPATNRWACSSVLGRGDAAATHMGGGTKATTGVLTRIEISASADTFDAGSISIMYE